MKIYHTGTIPSVSLILAYGRWKGKPYTGPIATRIKYRVEARNASEVYKTTGAVFRCDNPRQHPNDFEQACDEIRRLEQLPTSI